MRLYDIASEFKTLRDIAENSLEFDPETGEIIDTSDLINELFNELNMTLSDKLENSAYVISELEAMADALKVESKRLNERAVMWVKNAERLKGLMQYALEQTDDKKLKTDKFTFSLRKSESVEIDALIDVEDFDRKYVRIKREFDKTKIKSALKAGEEITGARIVEKQSLQIK